MTGELDDLAALKSGDAVFWSGSERDKARTGLRTAGNCRRRMAQGSRDGLREASYHSVTGSLICVINDSIKHVDSAASTKLDLTET